MKNRLRAAIGVVGLLTCVAALPVVAEPASPGARHQQAVLVTGASTGIGRKITERLAADGYFIYAGARKEADLRSLGAIKKRTSGTSGRDQSGRYRRCC
jgi:NADPH:quinone reductase-like Zn-dependent oxidoreductase